MDCGMPTYPPDEVDMMRYPREHELPWKCQKPQLQITTCRTESGSQVLSVWYCPFPRLLASHMAGFVIRSVYHFLVTPSSGYSSHSRKLMSPGNQEHRSHVVLSKRHLDEPIAESYSCLLSSRFSFFSLSLFLYLFIYWRDNVFAFA